MSTYVPGPNKFALLSNALTGAATGAKDFIQLKQVRDRMNQDQSQHQDRMAHAIRQLDEQILQADLDREQTKSINDAKNALEERMTRLGHLKAEERLRIQTDASLKEAKVRVGPQYAREKRLTRQWEVKQQEQSRSDLALSRLISTYPTIEDEVEIVDGMAPEEVNNAAIRNNARMAAFNQQVNSLANDMAATNAGGEVTPFIQEQARAIITNKTQFQERVYINQASLARSKLGRYSLAAADPSSSIQDVQYTLDSPPLRHKVYYQDDLRAQMEPHKDLEEVAVERVDMDAYVPQIKAYIQNARLTPDQKDTANSELTAFINEYEAAGDPKTGQAAVEVARKAMDKHAGNIDDIIGGSRIRQASRITRSYMRHKMDSNAGKFVRDPSGWSRGSYQSAYGAPAPQQLQTPAQLATQALSPQEFTESDADDDDYDDRIIATQTQAINSLELNSLLESRNALIGSIQGGSNARMIDAEEYNAALVKLNAQIKAAGGE